MKKVLTRAFGGQQIIVPPVLLLVLGIIIMGPLRLYQPEKKTGTPNGGGTPLQNWCETDALT